MSNAADSVVIVSGGLDSVTLLHHLVKTERRRPAVLTFHYGQKHAREIDCARYQAALLGCADHLVLDLALLGPLFAHSALVDASVAIPQAADVRGDPQPATYVPNRNMLFLALAAAFAEARGIIDVFYGAQAQDRYGYWDCTAEFLERMNAVLGLNRRRPIILHAPFMMM